MLGWIKSLPGLLGKGLGLADKVILNKDLVVRLAAEHANKELEAYIAAVTTQTLPLFDAIHKLSRPMIIFAVITLAACEAFLTGVEVTSGAWDVIMLLGGGYTLIKGRGK